MPPLLIRADASAEIGIGHVMRMIALAQAWQRRGGQVHLAAAMMPTTLLPRLKTEGIEVHHLDSIDPDGAVIDGPRPSRGDATDACRTTELATRLGVRWVVADGYVFGTDFQRPLHEAGFRVAVVTDFDYCTPWECNLIVNQNPHAEQEEYDCSLPSCQRLLGTRYILLRREFLTETESPPVIDRERPIRLLITLGGSDADNVTGRVLELLETNDCPPLDIRVLIGAASVHQAALRRATAGSRHSLSLLSSVTDMPQQYRWADGIISAAGSSCFEWMYFGLSAAIIVIADNQLPIYRELTDDGIAIGLAGTPSLTLDEETHATLANFLAGITPGKIDPYRFRHLVDGYGAQRVAAALDSEIWLREATPEDRERYFRWANDPVVRQNSLCSDEIHWSSHCDWFASGLHSHGVHLLVAMGRSGPVGQIRFTETKTGYWEVAFSVDPTSRGSGIGKHLLTLGIAWMQNHDCCGFVATVKADNQASARCFERLGWQNVPSDNPDLLQFRKDR